MRIENQIGAVTSKLNTLNQHDQSPGGILMAGTPRPSEINPFSGTEHLLFPDNTLGFKLDSVGMGLIRELEPGSIFGLMDFRDRLYPDQYKQAKQIMADYEMLALVLEQGENHIGVALFQNNTLNPSGEKTPAKWGGNVGKQFGLTPKEEALIGLSRLFDPSQGIEGSQMTTVLDITKNNLPGGNEVRSFGCYSHKDPMRATAMNILNGNGVLRFSRFCRPNLNQWVRLNVGESHPNKGEGLSIPQVADTEGFTTFHGLLSASERIAMQNPTNMGGGTDQMKVFDVLLESTLDLPEMAMNGANVSKVQENLRHKLGIRS